MSALTSTDTKPWPDLKLAAAPPRVAELIRRRWSPRTYANRDVAPEDLKLLFEAAHWSASCFNEQPWRFVVATKTDPANYAKVLACLVDKNQLWAKSAPVLMITAGKKTFSHNGSPDRYGLHDAGMALGYLMLQATELGLYANA